MKKHLITFILIFVFINSFPVSFPQVNENCIQIGYELLFTKSTRSKDIDLNPAKGRIVMENKSSLRSAISISYIRLFYMENDLNAGFRCGLLLPGQKEYQKVFIGIQLRYQFSNSFYLFNDYSLAIATWSKEGGNATSEPHDQALGSLGAGFNISKRLYGTISYTIPFSKASADSRESGYYNDRTTFELNGFIHAGVEIYF